MFLNKSNNFFSSSRRLLRLHPSRARRGVRTDNPLELSPAHASVETGARPGNRVHRRHEARRADPADRAVRGTAHQRGFNRIYNK